MSCAAIFAALRDTRLTATEKVIFGNIAGGYQTRAEIAKASSCAESSVPRAVRKLELLGYLEREFNKGKANTYKVLAQPDTGIAQDTGVATSRTDKRWGVAPDTGEGRPTDTGQAAIEDAEFVDNSAAHISTGARAETLTFNTTASSELNPEPVELAEAAVVAREELPLKLNGSAKAMPAHQLLANLIRIVDHWALQHTHGLHKTCEYIPQWIAAGADFDTDIVPTVAALCAKKTGPAVSSLRYFDGAIREATRSRLTILAQESNPIEARHVSATSTPATFDGMEIRRGKVSPGTALLMRKIAGGDAGAERSVEPRPGK